MIIFRSKYDPCREYLKNNDYFCNICEFNTNKINKRKDASLIKTKQYAMKEHLKNHNIKLTTAKDEWNKLTDEEKFTWKIGDDKKRYL